MYKIKSLRGAKPEPSKLYLFDANVWQFILTSPFDLKPYEQVYVDFFDRIIGFAKSKGTDPPYIYLNGLIISEVYNAFMKSKRSAYSSDVGYEVEFKEYRETEDFKKNSESIKSDMDAYSKSLIVVDQDELLDPYKIFMDLPSTLEYNDFFYYKLALAKNMTIVTNDRDFYLQDVEILTNNDRLLKAR